MSAMELRHPSEANSTSSMVRQQILSCFVQPNSDTWHVLCAGEYGQAAMSAVELQRSSEEDSANAALREQTEQRTSSLLQARSRTLLQWEHFSGLSMS